MKIVNRFTDGDRGTEADIQTDIDSYGRTKDKTQKRTYGSTATEALKTHSNFLTAHFSIKNMKFSRTHFDSGI